MQGIRYGLDRHFPEGIRGIVFDCDGVLFDSRASNIHYYNLLLDALGLPRMTPSQEDYVHMHTVGESLNHIVPTDYRDRLPEARSRIRYRQHILPLLEPEPGLRETLWWLRDAGVKLAVHTNRTDSMEYVLDHFGMTDFFFPVMTAGRVRAKPHPEGLHVILRSWGVAPSSIVFIGDTRLDEETARAAGVPFWAYRSPTLTAQVHVRDYWSLSQTLRGVLARDCD